MKLKYASGGVVEALKRYDRSIRVRWSWEKNKWAVESKAKRRDLLVPPVFYIPIPGTNRFKERLLPEKSDRAITFRDGYAIICWVSSLNWEVYGAIIGSDTARFASREQFLARASKTWRDQEEQGERDFARSQQETTDAAFDKYKWIGNRDPMSIPHGCV